MTVRTATRPSPPAAAVPLDVADTLLAAGFGPGPDAAEPADLARPSQTTPSRGQIQPLRLGPAAPSADADQLQ